jgi:hypothetical protein
MQFSTSLTVGALCAAAAIGCATGEGAGAVGSADAGKNLIVVNDAAQNYGPPVVHFGRVFELLNTRCLPCHSSTPDHPNASAKLDLSTQSAAYEQLVGALAKGGACNDGARLLVVAGDPDNSLLIQKLENAPGLCGNPMPKASVDQPFMPIDSMQIDEIRAWIHAGALND